MGLLHLQVHSVVVLDRVDHSGAGKHDAEPTRAVGDLLVKNQSQAQNEVLNKDDNSELDHGRRVTEPLVHLIARVGNDSCVGHDSQDTQQLEHGYPLTEVRGLGWLWALRILQQLECIGAVFKDIGENKKERGKRKL